MNSHPEGIWIVWRLFALPSLVVIVLQVSASVQSELEVVELFVILVVPSFDLRDSLILSHCQRMYI
jgi:hypothetical protein